MKRKTIFAVNKDGDGLEIIKFTKREKFIAARDNFTWAADAIREGGQNTDPGNVEILMEHGLDNMPKRSNFTKDLFDAYLYVIYCVDNNQEVYWPYVFYRLLDFLECEYITKESEV